MADNAPTPTDAKQVASEQYYWLWIVCLLGLDYFSTLAYQPSITYQVTKRFGPIATAAVVFVTLFGALPVYCWLAGRSPGGQGSLGIIEKHIRGWRGKTLVLIMLGFAATDFTMLKSLSLADASVHVLHKHDNDRREIAHVAVGWLKDHGIAWFGERAAPYFDEQLVVTILLGIVGFVFWFVLRKGFNRNVVRLAVPLVAIYLLMTGIVIAGGLWQLNEHREIFHDWWDQMIRGEFDLVERGGPPLAFWQVVLWALMALPNLALGLSGFEMSMILMPQVQGKPDEQPPRTRIRNTRKVLITAAVIMSIYLLGSVLVTTLLIPHEELQADGGANNRSLAYLAHGGRLTFGEDELLWPICGPVFGTAYDIVTVLILCLAGTSVMTALSVLLPLFLTRFGMEFRWTQRWGVLMMLFAAINTLVTVWFKAKVEDQRGAYATGVLVLIACAAVVTALDKKLALQRLTTSWRFLRWLDLGYFTLIAMVFVTTTLAVTMRSPSGLAISCCFIAAVVAMSILSRAWRADELRTIGFGFKDEQSKFLWDSLRLTDFPILVPFRPIRETYEQKEIQIREDHHLSEEVDIVFLDINVDDPSDFFQTLKVEVVRENHRSIIRVTGSVSVAHAIAATALEMSRNSSPPGLHFGWTEMDMLSASWSYLAFGEGNVPWKVRELIQHAEPNPAKRPRVIVG
ncbi:MAG: amino acid transporter [Gemmataceae bacterium]|nr:amino acid transporter [Gemmataceae bacterium]